MYYKMKNPAIDLICQVFMFCFVLLMKASFSSFIFSNAIDQVINIFGVSECRKTDINILNLY